MYDILLFIRPKHVHIWGKMDDIDIAGIIDLSCEKARNVLNWTPDFNYEQGLKKTIEWYRKNYGGKR